MQAPPSPDRSRAFLASGVLALVLALLSLPVGLWTGPEPLGLFLAPIPGIAAPPIAFLTWLLSAGYLRETAGDPARSEERQRTRTGVRCALVALPLAVLGGFGLLRGLYDRGPEEGHPETRSLEPAEQEFRAKFPGPSNDPR